MIRPALFLTVAMLAATPATSQPPKVMPPEVKAWLDSMKSTPDTPTPDLSWLKTSPTPAVAKTPLPTPKPALTAPGKAAGACDPAQCSFQPMDPLKPKTHLDRYVTREVPPPTLKKEPTFWAAEQRLLPPVKYDYKYTGRLEVMRLPKNEDVLTWCPSAKLSSLTVKACARPSFDRRPDSSHVSCTIFMPVDDVILALGYYPDTIYRHEQGHCNGWDDPRHTGAREATP